MNRTSFSLWLVLGSIGAGMLGPVSAATFTVGADGACSHSSLAAALSASAANGNGSTDLIRVANNRSYTNLSLNVTASVEIVGGYQSCADTSSNPNIRTVLQGSTSSDYPTFRASGTSISFLTLRNLDIVGATTSSDGGALAIVGNYYVTLDYTRLRGGAAEYGGGVFIDTIAVSGADLILVGGSSIEYNTAQYAGGGIYCSGVADIRFYNGSLHHNSATGLNSDGGGAALYDGCKLRQEGDVAVIGTSNNTAGGFGGGYFLHNGAELHIVGDNDYRPRLRYNVAESGGAVAVEDSVGADTPSVVDIRNAQITFNNAENDGGALALLNGGELTMRRTLIGDNCPSPTYCSDLSFNGDAETGRGGALSVASGAHAEISGTYIEGNRGYVSSVLWVEDDGEVVLDPNVISNNADAPALMVAHNLTSTGYLRMGWSTVLSNEWVNPAGESVISASGNGVVLVYGSILADVVRNGVRNSSGLVTVISDCVARDPYMWPLADDAAAQITLEAPYGISPTGHVLNNGTMLPVDYCDATGYGARTHGDIDGETAVTDAPRANYIGIHDLGADEYQLTDLIFANGFESL